MRAPLQLVVRRPNLPLHPSSATTATFLRTPLATPHAELTTTTKMLANPLRRALGRLTTNAAPSSITSKFVAPPPFVSFYARTYSSSSSSSPSDGSNKNASSPRPSAAILGNVPSTSVTSDTPGRIPFVPSTDHLRPSDVALSTFFALHRPLSIEKPLPKPLTIEQAAQILSEAAAASSQKMNRAQREAEAASEGPWDYGAPFVPPPTPRETIIAISVKRQRRLKMKKHKYKKLMKKTRNLRRRIERQRN